MTTDWIESTQLRREAAEAMRAGASRAAERVIAAIRSEVAVYDEALKGQAGKAAGDAVETAITRFIEMIEHPDADTFTASKHVFYDLGRGEFREGRALYELLRAYEVGALAALREIKAECDRAGVDPDVVYELAEAVIAYITKLSAASSDGYSAEAAAAAETTQAARDELVELLTAPVPPRPAQLDAAARGAHYSIPAKIAALASATGEPVELAAKVGPGAIGARIAGLACVLVPDPDSQRSRLTDIFDATDASLGPAVAVKDTAESWRLARRGLELLHSGTIDRHGLIYAEEHLTALVLGADEQLIAVLVKRRLAPIQTARGGHRQDLSQTLLAWLSYNGNVIRTADQLNVHSNTIRYRLRKLRELYGDQLDDPETCFELQLALRASGVRLPTAASATRSTGAAGGPAGPVSGQM